MVITSLQLVQMIIGCVVNYMAFNYKQNGQSHNSEIKPTETHFSLMSVVDICLYFIINKLNLNTNIIHVDQLEE